jgi:hypothetical protein
LISKEVNDALKTSPNLIQMNARRRYNSMLGIWENILPQILEDPQEFSSDNNELEFPQQFSEST